MNHRSPCGERRLGRSNVPLTGQDFNPRSPCGERHHRNAGAGKVPIQDFNPRSPCGERPLCFSGPTAPDLFQSTLPVWGATSGVSDGRTAGGTISIHAPRVGSDLTLWCVTISFVIFQSTLPVWGATNAGDIIPFYCNISIHAPRVGSDATRLITSAGLLGFQSTLPVWGATCSRPETAAMEPLISIHAPRVGSDERTGSGIRAAAVFQSTLPVWGATLVIDVFWKCGGISIHAPRVGSDGTGGADGGGVRHFNPRSPCGERLARSQTKGIFSKFQSTLPVWGATAKVHSFWV